VGATAALCPDTRQDQESFMAWTRTFALALLLGFGTLGLAACEDNDGPAEEAGEAVDNAGERAGEALEDAGENIQRKAE
jgi:hypothetical protein